MPLPRGLAKVKKAGTSRLGRSYCLTDRCPLPAELRAGGRGFSSRGVLGKPLKTAVSGSCEKTGVPMFLQLGNACREAAYCAQSPAVSSKILDGAFRYGQPSLFIDSARSFLALGDVKRLFRIGKMKLGAPSERLFPSLADDPGCGFINDDAGAFWKREADGAG